MLDVAEAPLPPAPPPLARPPGGIGARPSDIGAGAVRFAKDYIGVDYHNDTHSHVDALCHVAFEGCLYNGHPAVNNEGDPAMPETRPSTERMWDTLLSDGMVIYGGLSKPTAAVRVTHAAGKWNTSQMWSSADSPMYMSSPVLAGGNTAVVVTSKERPLPAITLAEVLATSDVPGGVVNLLTGDAEELGTWLAEHADVDAIDLTGAPAGRAMEFEREAAGTVKRVVRPPRIRLASGWSNRVSSMRSCRCGSISAKPRRASTASGRFTGSAWAAYAAGTIRRQRASSVARCSSVSVIPHSRSQRQAFGEHAM